jgi:hypothetical protein
MKKYYLIIMALMLFLSEKSFAQNEVIEIDTITATASKVMPYNRPFTVKMAIDADEVPRIYFIKRHKHLNLPESISYYDGKSTVTNPYTPDEISQNYYYVEKISGKNYLYITFADEYMFEPSASYYIIISQRKLAKEALGFFDNYYLSQYDPIPANRPLAFTNARSSLGLYESKMRKVFGTVGFGFLTLAEFNVGAAAFKTDFDATLLPLYTQYAAALTLYNSNIITNAGAMFAALPVFDLLTKEQLIADTTINKDALTYLYGKDLTNNNISSDVNTLANQSRIQDILYGVVSLECIFCNRVNLGSVSQSDYSKRISNIDATITQLNAIKRAMFLSLPKSAAGRLDANTTINNLITWMNYLEASKNELKGLLNIRKLIEGAIMDNMYIGNSFNNASIASGNSYLNFETRNKVLLTPDFGITTSAFTKDGNSLDYGIVPYLGFHINFMALDKDISFSSYKKNWKQYLSLMVGWSLVDMKQESKYDNFFEKSSLLTGIGYRLNNVIRITAGSQWLFKLREDSLGNHSRKLFGVAYVGLSFDLNIKQYLNGFTDLLSGIGKTKTTQSSNN